VTLATPVNTRRDAFSRKELYLNLAQRETLAASIYAKKKQSNARINRARIQRIKHSSLADESRAICAPVE
jgi:hypothetical protein